MATEHPDTVKRDPRSLNALAIYDSAYAMAYAIASLRSEPLTGSRIAAALRSLNQRHAPAVDVGKAGILDIYRKLGKRQPFDLRGATGRLDWDQNGDVIQDIDVLCVKTTVQGAAVPVAIGINPSGLYYDVRRNRFVGKIANCPGP